MNSIKKITNRFNVLNRFFRRKLFVARLAKKQRQFITSYLSENKRLNHKRFNSYGLKPFMKNGKWHLKVKKAHPGIPKGTMLDQDKFYALICGEQVSSRADETFLLTLLSGARDGLKKRMPTKGMKLVAGVAAGVLNPPGFIVTMSVYSMLKTVKGAHSYLHIRKKLAQTDDLGREFFKQELINAQNFARVLAPIFMELGTLGLIDNHVNEDIADLISEIEDDFDLSVSDEIVNKERKGIAIFNKFKLIKRSAVSI